jgi:hypothetical protein
MSLLLDWQQSGTSDFLGEHTSEADAPDVLSPHALVCRNVQFGDGQVGTRFGFTPAFNPNEAIIAAYNWNSALGNLLVYVNASAQVKIFNITAGTTTSAITTLAGSPTGATFAEGGSRLYVTGFNASGATGEGKVVTYQGGAFVADDLFPAPMNYAAPDPTEPSTGVVTAGTKYLAFVVEHRSGALSRLSPVDGSDDFTPVEFTCTGGRNLQWALNTTWPASAAYVHAVMTTAKNAFMFYFVPDASASVTGGATSTVTFTINVSDEELAATGKDASIYIDALTQTVAGASPFNLRNLVTIGKRMGYITTVADTLGNLEGALYPSDQEDYEAITADQHVVQLPGRRVIITACEIGGATYIFGPHYTYMTRDNSDLPVTWVPPFLVDGRRGTLAPRGVELAASKDYAWVADEGGLYYFQGAFGDLPISYHNSTVWKTINWNYAHTVQVKDHPNEHKVVVLAPLGSATAPSHMLVWDYQYGKTPDAVRFTLDSISGYAVGALEVVENTLSGAATANAKKQELWLFPSSAAAAWRQKTAADTTPYTDNGGTIASQYRTAYQPSMEESRGLMSQHHGAHLRVVGSGSLIVKMGGLDNSNQVTLTALALSTAPGEMEYLAGHALAEFVWYDFTNSGSGSWFSLSYMNHYYSPWMRQR